MNAFVVATPADGGSVVMGGRNHVMVIYDTADPKTCRLPHASLADIGDTVQVTNIQSGTITVRNPGDTTTIGSVIDSKMMLFRRSGSGAWDGPY